MDWKNPPFGIANRLPKVDDSPIRQWIAEKLLKAGDEGVSWTELRAAGWEPGVDEKRVDKAMSLLARRNGFRVQFQGPRVPSKGLYPTKWRLAPSH